MAKQGRWIKLHTKILWRSKVRKLTCTQKWIFVTLLILADENDGFILDEDANSAHLALAAGTDVRILRNSLVILHENSLIITHDNGDIEIPNWYKYQSTTAERDGRRNRQTAALDKSREDKSREDKNIYGEIFDFWTSFDDLPGRKITEEAKQGINARTEDGYTVKDIKTAIENYVKSTEEWVVKHRKQKGWTLGQFLSRYEGKNLERFKEPLMAEDGGSVDGLDSRRNGTGEIMKNGSIIDGIKYVDDGEGGLCPE